MNAPADFRALTVYLDIPHGLFPHLIFNRNHEPHLKLGEWALIDPTDRELQFGELYLFKLPDWLMIMQVMPPDQSKEEKDGLPCVKLTTLNHAFAHVGDHVPLEHLEGVIVGRIVGVLAPNHNADPKEISKALRKLGAREG